MREFYIYLYPHWLRLYNAYNKKQYVQNGVKFLAKVFLKCFAHAIGIVRNEISSLIVLLI